MRKIFVVIALAVTLRCAFSAYETKNYAKDPISIIEDSDINFTNMSALRLDSLTLGEVYLLSQKVQINSENISASKWNIWYKKLDAKTLTISSNDSVAFTAPLNIFFYNNYAIFINSDNDTNIPQLRLYQIPLNGGAALSSVTLSKNRNKSFTPVIADYAMIGKTVYIFYIASYKRLKVINIRLGSSTVGKGEFTVTATFDSPASLQVVWGESLSNNQLFAMWIENQVLMESVIDVSKRTVTPTVVGAYDKAFYCLAYATKKYYGEVCVKGNFTDNTFDYYIKTNTTPLAPLVSYPTETSALYHLYAYGPYLVVIFIDSTTISSVSVSYSYEIWNLDTLTPFKDRTYFLNIYHNSTFNFYKVPGGGLYTLLYDNRKEVNDTISNVKIGLLLDSYASLDDSESTSNRSNQTSSPGTEGCTRWNVASGCTSCQTGYFLQVPRCIACPVGCSNCSDADTCTACLPGYLLNHSTAKCFVTKGCSNWTMEEGCTCCQSGFFLQDQQCIACPSGCSECRAADKCLICLSGFYLDSTSAQCIMSCPSGCSNCNDPNTCIICLPGYYLNSQDNCVQCSSKHCASCDDQNGCTSCINGYYLFSGGICFPCAMLDSKCVSCDTTSAKCLECEKGYYISQKIKCLACSAGCEICADDATCRKCKPNHYLNLNQGCTPLH